MRFENNFGPEGYDPVLKLCIAHGRFEHNGTLPELPQFLDEYAAYLNYDPEIEAGRYKMPLTPTMLRAQKILGGESVEMFFESSQCRRILSAQISINDVGDEIQLHVLNENFETKAFLLEKEKIVPLSDHPYETTRYFLENLIEQDWCDGGFAAHRRKERISLYITPTVAEQLGVAMGETITNVEGKTLVKVKSREVTK